MAITAFLLFIFCTFDLALLIVHSFQAFVKPTDAEKVLLDLASWINITRAVNQAITMIICDFVLIYRCWIVYGRRWKVIIPSLILYLGNLAVTGKISEIGATLETGAEGTFNSDSVFRPWLLAFFGTIATQNIMTTSILILRIWRVEKQSMKYLNQDDSPNDRQTRCLRRAIRVIAESGAAYTACVIASFVSEAAESNAFYPIADIAVQMTGIAFNMILVRSSLKRDQQFTMFDQNERTTVRDPAGQCVTPGKILEGSISIHRHAMPQGFELVSPQQHQFKVDEKSSGISLHPESTNTVV